MVRAALWLIQEVGEGNVFTKEELRQAFPGISQADRRVRDLRDYGWVLDTSLSDAGLTSDEQRFVKAGVPVWDPPARRAAASSQGPIVTAKQRAAIFAADGYQCVSCGIAGGEAYLDNPSETAVLAISKRAVADQGRTEIQLVTECKRCRTGAPERSYDVSELRNLIRELSAEELRTLMRWAERGRRGGTPVERAWNAVRTLPAEARDQLLRDLRTSR
jgi:hypothetical protein